MRSCKLSISFCLLSSSLNIFAIAVAICRAAEITARITEAFSTVEIAAAPVAAAAVAPAAEACTAVSMPPATFLPTSPIAFITSDVASMVSSIKSRALPIPFATSCEKTAARFFALLPTPLITPPTTLRLEAKRLYAFVVWFCARIYRCSALFASLVAFPTFSLALFSLS